jgi:hypothetical protein
MMRIRAATEPDLPGLLELQVIQKHRNIAFRGDGTTLLQFVTAAVASGSCDVAVADDWIAGVIVIDYSFFGFGFVPLLIARVIGVGYQLMLHAEGQCRTKKLFTSTERSNLAMQALLARLGYLRCGAVECLEAGAERADPELIYCKTILTRESMQIPNAGMEGQIEESGT